MDLLRFRHEEHQHDAGTALQMPGGAIPEASVEPKVAIRSSVKPDYVVCLEDGKRMKMLKRHLRTEHQMSPRSVSQKVGSQFELPDGRTELRQSTSGPREVDRAWHQAAWERQNEVINLTLPPTGFR